MNDYIYEFKDLPSTDIPYNAETFNAMQLKLLDSIFPIGRGFIDFTNTDYSNYLGFTWERELVGLTPVGLDTTQTEFNTIGKTGGKKTHTLTIDEMPKHNHSLFASEGGAVQFPPYSAKSNGDSGASQIGGYATITTYSGSDQPHNNLQPYQVVAYWKRVA